MKKNHKKRKRKNNNKNTTTNKKQNKTKKKKKKKKKKNSPPIPQLLQAQQALVFRPKHKDVPALEATQHHRTTQPPTLIKCNLLEPLLSDP